MIFTLCGIFVFGKIDSTESLIDSTAIVVDTIMAPQGHGEVSNSEAVSFLSIFLSVLLPGLIGSLSVLFSDAAKYINTPEWNWSIFVSTKIKPFLIINIIALFIIAISQFVPSNYIKFISDIIGTDLSIVSTAALYAAATAIFDGWLKKKAQ